MATLREEEAMDAEHCQEVASVSSCLGCCSLSEPNGHSPEDLLWADSCLVNHPEQLNGDWSSLKYALSEIHENNPGSSIYSSDVSMELTDTDTDAERFIDHPGSLGYVFPAEDEVDTFLSQILEWNVSEKHIQDVIESSYNGSTEVEGMKDKNLVPAKAKMGMLEASSLSRGNERSSGLETGCSTEHMETQTWIEEDGKQEFLKRLEKALKAVSIHSLPSALSGSMASNVVSVDDIVARIRKL